MSTCLQKTNQLLINSHNNLGGNFQGSTRSFVDNRMLDRLSNRRGFSARVFRPPVKILELKTQRSSAHLKLFCNTTSQSVMWSTERPRDQSSLKNSRFIWLIRRDSPNSKALFYLFHRARRKPRQQVKDINHCHFLRQAKRSGCQEHSLLIAARPQKQGHWCQTTGNVLNVIT